MLCIAVPLGPTYRPMSIGDDNRCQKHRKYVPFIRLKKVGQSKFRVNDLNERSEFGKITTKGNLSPMAPSKPCINMNQTVTVNN